MDVAEEDVGEVIAEAEIEVSTSSLSLQRGSKREIIEWVRKDEEDGGIVLPHVGKFTRTNTDVPLIGGNEESCGSACKTR